MASFVPSAAERGFSHRDVVLRSYEVSTTPPFSSTKDSDPYSLFHGKGRALPSRKNRAERQTHLQCRLGELAAAAANGRSHLSPLPDP